MLKRPAAVARFTTHGKLTLSSTSIRGANVYDTATPGQPCSGDGGFDDLTAGSQVKVADASGKTLALGQLDPGEYDDQLGTCTFAFTVTGTPARQEFYGVTVGHRNGPQFTYAQMQAGPSLSIKDS